MSKKAKKSVNSEVEVVDQPEIVDSEVENPKFEPEVVDEGVIREEKKETPMDLVNSTVKVRKEGNWKKVSDEELAELEAKGVLVGYDRATQEALIRN